MSVPCWHVVQLLPWEIVIWVSTHDSVVADSGFPVGRGAGNAPLIRQCSACVIHSCSGQGHHNFVFSHVENSIQ